MSLRRDNILLDTYIDLLKDLLDFIYSLDLGMAYMSRQHENVVLTDLETLSDVIREYKLELAIPGIQNKIDAAVRYFLTDPEQANAFMYGPAPVGNAKGVLEELLSELKRAELKKQDLALVGVNEFVWANTDNKNTEKVIFRGCKYRSLS